MCLINFTVKIWLYTYSRVATIVSAGGEVKTAYSPLHYFSEYGTPYSFRSLPRLIELTVVEPPSTVTVTLELSTFRDKVVYPVLPRCHHGAL